jgi:hypothetical protein
MMHSGGGFGEDMVKARLREDPLLRGRIGKYKFKT